jgi:endonuclease/exonuclease/phosphatase (EEP) superfamily protein YafD
MDISDNDSPSTFKDVLLTSLLMLAISGLAYAYRQYQNSQAYLRKIICDIEGLSKAEETLKDMQESLQRKNSKLQEQQQLQQQQQQQSSGIVVLDQAEVSTASLEVSRLREEVDILRNELQQAEIRFLQYYALILTY